MHTPSSRSCELRRIRFSGDGDDQVPRVYVSDCASIWFFHSRADVVGWVWGPKPRLTGVVQKGVVIRCTEYLFRIQRYVIRNMYNHEQRAADEATDDSIAIRPIFTCEDRTYGRGAIDLACEQRPGPDPANMMMCVVSPTYCRETS